MKFQGVFLNEKGKKVNWWFKAESEDALREHLREQGWQIVSMKGQEQIVSSINIFYGAKVVLRLILKVANLALAVISFPIALILVILDRIGKVEREKTSDRKKVLKEAEQILKEASRKVRWS